MKKTTKRIFYIMLVFLIFSATCFIGCTYRKDWVTENYTSKPIPEEFGNFVKKHNHQYSFQETLEKDTGDYQQYSVDISDNSGKILTKLRWYRSKNSDLGTPRPLDFVWPILVGKSMPVATLFAEHIFAPMGIDVVIIRQTETLFSGQNPRELKDFTDFHKHMVSHLVHAIAWAKTKQELDPQRFGMTGTSYGGIMTTICIPYTPGFISYKILMAGGDTGEILLTSEERKVVRWRKSLFAKKTLEWRKKIKEQSNYQKHPKIYEQWIRAQILKDFIEEAEKLPLDPNSVTEYVHPSRVAMVVTLYDKLVPTEKQIKLWENFKKPDTLFVRTGHFTLALAYFQVSCFIREMAEKHYRSK